MKTILFLLFGLVLVLPATAQQSPEDSSQRERAIAQCKAHRGVDCVTDEGLAEWLLQERSRSEAEAEGSRSKNQTAPRPAPRPTN
jgi:hypothetical protein